MKIMRKQKLAALALALCLLLPIAAQATVTHPATGEEITLEGGRLSVYDRDVFYDIPKGRVYRGIVIEDAPTPLTALTLVVQDLLRALQEGELERIEIIGLENIVGDDLAERLYRLSIVDQINGVLFLIDLEDETAMSEALEALGLDKLDVFDEEAEVFTLDPAVFPESMQAAEVSPAEFAAGSIASRYGYLGDGNAQGLRAPFMGISFEMVYAPIGPYSGQDEPSRTYVENYNFAWGNHNQSETKHWGLISIVRGVTGFLSGGNVQGAMGLTPAEAPQAPDAPQEEDEVVMMGEFMILDD